MAFGCRDQLKQVFLNLLKNAAEATASPEGQVEVTASQEESHVLIRIRDNGCGIPEEYLPRIWEPFFTTKGQAGTGLGLDLCRQIVEAHGGTLTVESRVGQGTTFTVRLPGATESQESAKP